MDEGSDADSLGSPKMETVEVIKLHMTTTMPEGLHPHRMDLIMVVKNRPSKVPNPTTKKDGRVEVYPVL